MEHREAVSAKFDVDRVTVYVAPIATVSRAEVANKVNIFQHVR